MAAAHEATTDEELQQWHDQAYAAYQEALDAYQDDCKERRLQEDPDGVDEGLLAAYEEARDELQTGVVYWRQVGEQTGTRTGILTEGDTEGDTTPDSTGEEA